MTDAPSYILAMTQTLGERPVSVLRCNTRIPGATGRFSFCNWRRDAVLEPLEDTGLAIARIVALWVTHAAEEHRDAAAAALSSPVVEPPEAPLG